MIIPIFSPAPAWTAPHSRYITFYHGCTAYDQANIETGGIDLSYCRVDTDFGRGFYTTTVKYQAEQWAWKRLYSPGTISDPTNRPVVLKFRVERRQLAKLTQLSFVLAGPTKDDFWSFVQHCRQSSIKKIHDHRGPVAQPDGTKWYDVACGPVAAFWLQKFALQDADQISFHTDQAIKLLNRLIKSGDRQKFSVDYVV